MFICYTYVFERNERKTKKFIEENKELMLKTIRELCHIPAPSHFEDERALYCKNWLEKYGAKGVYIDSAKNVIFPINCDGSNEITVFVAHTDTVFPDREPYPYREDEENIYCPGVSDDTASVVALMLQAKYFIENNIVPEKGVMMVLNACKEGYYADLDETECEFGELKFVQGETHRHVAEINPKDIERVDKAIYEAQLQADYIIISVHSHQLSGDKKENPSQFLIDFAHHCIDMGANAIVGHGPHLLRPIEVYKDSPIFYSLGDFILQLYSIEFAPNEFFENHGLTPASTVHELLKSRSKNFTVGLMADPKMFRAVIPCWETEGTKLKKITLMPVEMSMTSHKSDQGLPRRVYTSEICDYLAEMCQDYGTKLTMQPDGLISVEW